MIRGLFGQLRQQWLGALAFGLVLTGGTAYALDGSNTVFSDDIVNSEVRTADIRDGNVTQQDIKSAAVTEGKLGENAVTEGKLAGVDVLRAGTDSLVDTTANNAGVSSELLKIGEVSIIGFCTKQSGGVLTGGMQPRAPDGFGAVFVQDDVAVELVDFDVQLIVFASDDSFTGRERSFGLLDTGAGSVTGVAAMSIDPASGRCAFSVHALGRRGGAR